MNTFVQNLIDGLGNGSTYALLAVGVSMLFGVMHLVNFAHGELLTVSAYVIYGLRSKDVSWWITVPMAILGAVALSVAIEFTAFRRVRTASAFTLLLTSFALEILSHAVWRIGVSSKPRRYATPEIAFKTFDLGPYRVEVWDVISIVVAVLCFVGTAIMLRKTLFGLSIRAASEDFDAARLMGVKANRVISGAFAFAGLLAGIAGALYLLRRGQADPRMGAEPLLKAVIAAIIGGLGSLKGAVVGGLALGVAEVYFRSFLPNDLQGLTDAFVFVLIAALFVVRPQGLFNVQTAERV
ncbi:MAG: branched-chain amino acid transport system permease protein [Acidimicrobiaceae bacterium]|jgi:branched-chain amino acid transport system permease protein|nr:MAG: branched-chain amino acid transport system permease protein [Acidimicrobiaceae bacterium]